MTTYAVFDRNAKGAPAVIPDRFSWFAALLPPVFALVHGLWLELVAYIALVALLSVASLWIGDDASFWIYVVFALWIGFEAAGLRRTGLEERVIKDAVPFLGICVGMQLMAERGLEKGVHDGLGWIPGAVQMLAPSDPDLKVPHMGWNTITIEQPHPLFAGIPDGEDG